MPYALGKTEEGVACVTRDNVQQGIIHDVKRERVSKDLWLWYEMANTPHDKRCSKMSQQSIVSGN